MGVKRVAQFMAFFFSLYNAYHVFAAFSRIFPQLLCTVGFSNRRKTLSSEEDLTFVQDVLSL